ncbi:mandelate racemase/muconate lactonizing enzyme family protein [SAR202 cluster bacterium AC-647-P02_OGT_505m]|nr:mandelate racemase/muconate lactonizing enzyme family protein [SAR202 cluster bacterium AC-647-P02_OGT_505m]
MKIVSSETGVVSIPREEGPLTGGMGKNAEFVTIKIMTEDGIEGIGYSGFASSVMLKALKESVDALLGQIVGKDPRCVENLNNWLRELAGGGAPSGLVTRAISGIDVALWDIKGKSAGEPLHRLLGGYRDKVPTYASGFLWRTYDLDQLAETSSNLVKQGFKAMKFRMGAENSAAKEIARMKVMREAVGPDVTIMLDINQGWDVNTAISIGRQLYEYDLYWLEDPVNHQDFAGLARIADSLDTPIAAGEYHYGLEAFRTMLELRSIDIAMVDLLRVGGITQWMKAAHTAEAYNVPVVSHLATEVLAHGVAASPNGTWVEHMPWTFGMFTEEPKIVDGMIVMSDSPGLGIEFDEDKLKMFQHQG